MKRRILTIFFLIFIVFGLKYVGINAKSNNAIEGFIFFYSPTCISCSSVESYIDTLSIPQNIKIKKFDISTQEGNKEFEAYCNAFNVPFNVFAGEKYYIGAKEIIANLQNIIISSPRTVIISKNIKSDNMHKLNVITYYTSGFVNGLNPCSLALLLTLITIIICCRNKSIIIISYILTKFAVFFLLGTILFKFIKYLNIESINNLLKLLLLIFISTLIILNVLDAYNAHRERYGKVKLKLPSKVNRICNKLFNKLNSKSASVYIVTITIIVSIMISLTEFMCTGQIYLISILSLI